MKITKDQLIDLLEGETRIVNRYDMIDEIFAGTLEIEGYERNQWHKFDPKDESTFPPIRDKDYLICHNYFGEKRFRVDDFCLGLWKLHRSVIAWRELPEVPKI